MNVLLVYQDRRLPSTRIRSLQMVPHLQALGAQCAAVEYPARVIELRRLLQRAARADVVVLHSKTPPLIDALLWRTLRRPLVFDFDDAIMFRDRRVRGSYVSRTRQQRFARIVRVASAFICGNPYLATFVAGTEKPMLISASPVPIDVPRRAPEPREGRQRIGWIGGRGNLSSLVELAGAFRRLGRTNDFVLAVISDAAPEIDGCHVEHVPWTLASQDAELARLDIGVMPLTDSPWTRGKCAYKLLQYMAAEVPAVASPVGMNATLIAHGKNGLLASTEDEWVAALGGLLADSERRAALGAAGRRTVEAGYTYQTTSRRWMEFFATLASTSSAA